MADRLSYVYRIDFPDGSWYWGVRLCPHDMSPEDDSYAGSPVTHKEKWASGFEKSIIKTFFDFTEASNYEIELIKADWSNELCLNENCGGAISRLGCSKGGKKAAERTRGHSRPNDVKRKISEAHKGKKLSFEHIQKLKMVKRPLRTLEQSAKYVQSRRKNRDQWHSEETRRKISEANRGRECQIKTREKISQAVKGKRWFNNGELETQSHTCPEGWKPGRVFRPRNRRG